MLVSGLCTKFLAQKPKWKFGFSMFFSGKEVFNTNDWEEKMIGDSNDLI